MVKRKACHGMYIIGFKEAEEEWWLSFGVLEAA
jgi:hypothetical protein